jgi:hypothetical protein
MSNTATLNNIAAPQRHDSAMRGQLEIQSVMSLPPRAGQLLTKLTQTADFETALWKMLADYTTLKIKFLREQIQKFEMKWGMTFAEFTEQSAAGRLKEDPYAYEVESDFWDWEQAETLLAHYEALQIS